MADVMADFKLVPVDHECLFSFFWSPMIEGQESTCGDVSLSSSGNTLTASLLCVK